MSEKALNLKKTTVWQYVAHSNDLDIVIYYNTLYVGSPEKASSRNDACVL